MIYIAIYLYVLGGTMMWWFARSTEHRSAAKGLAVIFWPILVPITALWG